jgi:hypothetical protein
MYEPGSGSSTQLLIADFASFHASGIEFPTRLSNIA